MRRRFSREYATFEAWASAQPARTPYVARIARTHARYPKATLGQLRRHPGRGQKALSTVPKAPPSLVPYAQLSRREQASRRRALEVLSGVRRGEGSLSGLARKERISPSTVRRATGALRKKGSRWVATRNDRVQRWLKTYEKGYRTEVLVSDSRTASLLSQYSNAVGRYIQTGDPSGLAEFWGRTYVDALRKVHTFETDPAKIRAAIERSESDFGAFADLYSEPEEASSSG